MNVTAPSVSAAFTVYVTTHVRLSAWVSLPQWLSVYAAWVSAIASPMSLFVVVIVMGVPGLAAATAPESLTLSWPQCVFTYVRPVPTAAAAAPAVPATPVPYEFDEFPNSANAFGPLPASTTAAVLLGVPVKLDVMTKLPPLSDTSAPTMAGKLAAQLEALDVQSIANDTVTLSPLTKTTRFSCADAALKSKPTNPAPVHVPAESLPE